MLMVIDIISHLLMILLDMFGFSPLGQKSEAIAVFLHFNKLVERQFQTQIKCYLVESV